MAEDEVELPVPKGSYNLDFDALDDSFNPFVNSKKLRSSPPLEEQVAKSAPVVHDTESEKDVTCDPEGKVKDCDGSKVDSAVDAPAPSSAVSKPQDAGDSSPAVSTEKKVVKKKGTKVVKKPKSRPVSKNLDEQGAPDVDVNVAGQAPSSPALPASGNTICPPVSSTPPQEVHDHGDASAVAAVAAPAATTTTPTPEKSPQPGEGSESAESTPKREKTGVKVKKSKHKSSRRSGSHLEVMDTADGVRRDSESRDSGGEPAEREVRGSSRSSASSVSGESQGGLDRALAGEAVKTKHPAARVLEQQVQGEITTHHADSAHAASLGKPCLSPDSDLESFYDAYDSPPNGTMSMVPEMENFTEMDDSHVLFQSQDYIHGLSWSHDDDGLLDEGAGEATVGGDDFISGESEMAGSHHTNESVVKLVQVLKYSQSDWNKLKQELELGFQAQLLAKEREWSNKLADRDARIATLEENNKKLRQTNEDMRVVVAEFEKTISQLQSEKEKTSNASQQSLQDVVKERDQALEDLQSVETAFSDLHRRYEKTKAVVEGFKQNEEVLKKCVADLQNKLKKTEQKVQTLKSQAEEKLEKATEEIEKAQKASSSEIARLEAALRKAELQVQSQEALLEQKVKENKELAAICDELIAKVQ